jgi:hypothetical protein
MYYIVSSDNISLVSGELSSPKKKLVQDLLKDEVISMDEALLLLDGESPIEESYNRWTMTTTEDSDYTITY